MPETCPCVCLVFRPHPHVYSEAVLVISSNTSFCYTFNTHFETINTMPFLHRVIDRLCNFVSEGNQVVHEMHSSISPGHTLSLTHTMGSNRGRATQGGSSQAKGGARDPWLALKLGGIGFQQLLKVSIHVLVYYLCRGWPP